VRVLGVETATPLASSAVVDASGVLAERVLRGPMRHLEWLAPAVDGMLRDAGLGPGDVEGIAVSVGPGGFTGLRIGIATAAAWARARRTPLVGVGTLEALALAAGLRDAVLAALDAHRGEVAAALYRVPVAGEPEPLVPPTVAPPEAVAAEVLAALRGAAGSADPGPGRVLVVGDALSRYAQPLLGALDGRGVPGPPYVHPRAAVVAWLGRLRLIAGARDDPGVLLPVYGRRPALREWQESPAQPGNG